MPPEPATAANFLTWACAQFIIDYYTRLPKTIAFVHGHRCDPASAPACLSPVFLLVMLLTQCCADCQPHIGSQLPALLGEVLQAVWVAPRCATCNTLFSMAGNYGAYAYTGPLQHSCPAMHLKLMPVHVLV